MAIHLEILAHVNERKVAREADKIADQFEYYGKEAGMRWSDQFSDQIAKSSPKVQRALNSVTKATERATKMQAEYSAALEGGDNDKITRASSALRSAKLSEADAFRSAGTAMRSWGKDLVDAEQKTAKLAHTMQTFNTSVDSVDKNVSRSMSNITKNTQSSFGGLIDSIADFGRTSGYLARGILSIALPKLIYDIAAAGSALSGALGPLAAGVGAAGVAFGSLKLGMSGFTETIEDIRDIDKFNEGLAQLSPNAQQAAIALRNLLPEIDSIIDKNQDALFAGVGDQFDNIMAKLGPSVESATTGVNAQLNQMFMNLTDQLMSPGTFESINQFLNNTVEAARQLAPAIAPAVSAFSDFMAAGSDFLPGLAADIASIAREFADWMREMKNSGDMGDWMGRGVETLKELLSLTDDLGKLVGALGHDGANSMAEFVTSVELCSEAVRLLSGDFSALEDAVPSIGDALVNKMNSVLGVINLAIKGINFAVKVANSLGANLPMIPEDSRITMEGNNFTIGNIPGGTRKDENGRPINGPVGGGGSGAIDNQFVPGYSGGAGTFGSGDRSAPQIGESTTENKLRKWHDPATDKDMVWAPGVGWIPDDDPRLPESIRAGTPKGREGDKPSETEIREGVEAGLDPNSWKVDPFAGVPAQYAAPGYGGVNNNPQEMMEAQHKVISEAKDLEDAHRERMVAEQDGISTQREIDDAKQKEIEAGWALQKAQADLVEKARGTARDLKGGMGELGAALDPDFGISKGLAGLAENLTKFVANLAFAPMMGRLAAISAANPSQGGFGALGIMGAQGAFGSQFLGLDTGSGSGGYGGGGYGGSYGMPGMSNMNPNLAAMMDLAQSSSGNVKYEGASDLAGGLADCSGSISDLVETLQTGAATPARLFDTTAFANDKSAAAQGFYPGYQPGALNVGVNPYPGMSGHMAATLPNGINFEGGGGTGGGAQYGGSASGALDPQFEKQYYMPIPVMPQAPGYAAGGAVWNKDKFRKPFGPYWGPSGGRMAKTPDGFNDWIPEPGQTGGGFHLGPTPSAGGDFGTIWDFLNPGGKGWDPGDSTKGGRVSGKGGPTSDSVASWLSRGEHVLTAADVSALGGQGGVYAFRNALHRAGGGAADDEEYPGVGAGAAGPTQIGSKVQPGAANMGGTGGIGLSGGAMDMAMMAAGGLDLLMPGAGQAAQTGIKLANRAIQYGSQLAGIAVSGLMETFLPTGGSALANNGWIPRIVGGIAGAKPALPNTAGQQAKDQQQPPLTPQQAGEYAQSLGQTRAGNVINNDIKYSAYGQTEDQNGKHLTQQLGYQYAGAQR